MATVEALKQAKFERNCWNKLVAPIETSNPTRWALKANNGTRLTAEMSGNTTRRPLNDSRSQSDAPVQSTNTW